MISKVLSNALEGLSLFAVVYRQTDSLDHLEQYKTQDQECKGCLERERDLSEVDVECRFVHICPGSFHSFR